ncbi:MAG: hypothetical protein ACYDAD_11190 [Acidimicrobiales bacterium]
MRVALSNDGWAELRPPEALRNRDRRAAWVAITDAPNDVLRGYALNDVILVAAIESWSLGPLPKDSPGVLDDLSIEDYDLIAKATEPHRDRVFGVSTEPNPDPASPIPPSSV